MKAEQLLKEAETSQKKQNSNYELWEMIKKMLAKSQTWLIVELMLEEVVKKLKC